MNNTKIIAPKRKNQKLQKRADLIFCLVILLIPTVQFCIFYIGVHFNSLLLSIQQYDAETGKYYIVGFDNIAKVFKDFVTEEVMIKGLRNSLVFYLVNLLVGTTLAILFSYVIFKKVPMYGTLRVMLFFPSIISPVVLVLLFRNFVGTTLPYIIQNLTGAPEAPLGLLSNPDTQFGTLMFYSIWVAFGSPVLLYSGAMSGINESIIEAAKIDGTNNVQELVKIVLPMIYPTFVTFITAGVAGILSHQMGLYSFFGTRQISYDIYTIGYYLFRQTALISGNAGYPPVAALGIVLSVFTIPVALAVRWLLTKFGPSVE